MLTRNDGKLNVTRMSAIVDQVVWLRRQGYEVILVSSGAVAAGRAELSVQHKLDSVEQRQLFSAIGQVKLTGLYYDLFREYGIRIGQVLTMKENFASPFFIVISLPIKRLSLSMRYSFECGTLYFSIDCTATTTFEPLISSSPLKCSSVDLFARITLGNNFIIFIYPL